MTTRESLDSLCPVCMTIALDKHWLHVAGVAVEHMDRTLEHAAETIREQARESAYAGSEKARAVAVEALVYYGYINPGERPEPSASMEFTRHLLNGACREGEFYNDVEGIVRWKERK